MSKKSLILSLAAVAVLSLSALAVAGPGFGPGAGPGGCGGPMQALTPEQREQALALFEEHQKAMIPLREQIRTKSALLDSALSTKPVDEKAVDTLTRELGDLKVRQFAAQVELRKKFAAAGLPDLGTMMGRHGMGRGMGPGAGGCPGQDQGMGPGPRMGSGPRMGAAMGLDDEPDMLGMAPGMDFDMDEDFAGFGS